MAIRFHDDQVKSGLKDRRKIKQWIKSVIEEKRRVAGNINIILTGDEQLREMNRKYLSRDYYTDVISFDYSEGEKIHGDVFISIDRVDENAAKYGVELKEELMRVMVHGILHLMGYRDSNDKQKLKMRNMEDRYLKYIL